ncbi:MAG: tetratricopeptide repeat protein [Gemmataceae bacterium]|nr:tetratricopeptide repeat protein [Gemmataceae bacterium]
MPARGKPRSEITARIGTPHMQHVFASIACLIAVANVDAGATLKEARKEWLEGNYSEAREMYEELVKDAKTRHGATLGLSQAFESQGEYDKAQKIVEALLTNTPKDADLLARLAELHHTRGRFAEAEKAAQSALAENKDHFLAHWVLGHVYRDQGQTEKADAEFLWFVRASNAKDITDPDQLRLVGLAGLERARALHLTDQFRTIIRDYFGAAIKADKLYWLGEYEAGRVYMDKHDKPGAFAAFERALAINPLAPEMMVAKGQMAATVMEFKSAERFAERALKINPRYVPALCLMADVHWFSGENDATLKMLARAQAVNPRDEATLARLAACYHVQQKMVQFESVVAEVKKTNPKCYTFYTDLAGLLEHRKMYGEAEKYYGIAITMQPKFPEAQVGLGMLHMRSAKEAEARKFLENAKAADPFNERVFNSLLVLDHLDKYESKETKHFIIRYDQKNDEVLANFMAIYLEDIYKDLADQFDYRPAGPFQIQIFKRHDMFSGRVVALPDLHTIGACTGPLVAMVSPRDTKKITKLFNWNRVIRHELVHVFNLQQTQGRVPHWFTEGLAVRYEGPHIPPSWHALLAEKYNTNDLLDLDTILLGFIRPRSPLQWQQAYLQSLLYVEYLTKTHGEKSIGKMLAAFAEGLDTGPALEKACNVKKEAFEKGYREFLGEKVKNIAAPPARKEMTLKQLREANAKNPDDVDLAIQLAEKCYFLGKKKDARVLVDKILRNDAKNPGAVYVKALLLLDDGKADTAISLLDSVANDDLKDTKPLKLYAKLQFDGKKFAQAATTCERGRKIDPHDTTWIKLLGVIYVQTKQKDKLIEIAEEVTKMDVDDLGPRKMLARHYLDLGKHAEAERFARMGLEIDVLDRECQQIILEAMPALNRQEEADRLRKIFGM